MICFIVLNYLAFEQTIESVDKILKLIGNKKIVIVDNFSYNNSFVELKKKYADNVDVSVIQTNNNIGFAQGNNFGYQFAKEKYNPDFMVVMNSDVIIQQLDFCSRIYKSYEQNSFDIMGPDIVTCNGKLHQNPRPNQDFTLVKLNSMKRKLIIKNHVKFLYWVKWKLLKTKSVKRKQNATTEKSNYLKKNIPLHGSLLVFSRRFINENINCFYPKTFMYLEAEILYYLAMNKKYTTIYDPQIIVVHKDDISTDKTFSNRYNKAVFSNSTLLKSVNSFIELRKNRG